jgi:hypothetical protein
MDKAMWKRGWIMSSVSPEDYLEKFSALKPEQIFSVIVDQYGRKLADELALKCVDAYKTGWWPRVAWPSF